ncbi:MAG: DUF1674 domain-containing protein [Rhizobiaceae bacterium]
MTSSNDEADKTGGQTKGRSGAGEAARQVEPARVLSAAARRALAEAEARRLQAKADMPREIGGRGGPDPVRFGDWEIKGRATDF